jgi:hypothetical protein
MSGLFILFLCAGVLFIVVLFLGWFTFFCAFLFSVTLIYYILRMPHFCVVETESNRAVVPQYPASDFVKTYAFSHVALPTGPESYFPTIVSLKLLLDEIKGASWSSEKSSMLKLLVTFKSALTFNPPKDAEESYCRQNLNVFMTAIRGFCDNNSFEVQAAKQV